MKIDERKITVKKVKATGKWDCIEVSFFADSYQAFVEGVAKVWGWKDVAHMVSNGCTTMKSREGANAITTDDDDETRETKATAQTDKLLELGDLVSIYRNGNRQKKTAAQTPEQKAASEFYVSTVNMLIGVGYTPAEAAGICNKAAAAGNMALVFEAVQAKQAKKS